MKTIGLLSDTHGYLNPSVLTYFKDVDEIWHAGDIGSNVLEHLQKNKPIQAVYGNIDDQNMRYELPEDLVFSREGLNILITHIGALPPKFNPRIRELLLEHKINLFICGHSHILRVIKSDFMPRLVYINPGAAGRYGFHKIPTLMKMSLADGKVLDLKVIEMKK